MRERRWIRVQVVQHRARQQGSSKHRGQRGYRENQIGTEVPEFFVFFSNSGVQFLDWSFFFEIGLAFQ